MCANIGRHHSLQHAASHYDTLQRAATHRNTLQHKATYCNTLQHTATHCNTLLRKTTGGVLIGLSKERCCWQEIFCSGILSCSEWPNSCSTRTGLRVGSPPGSSAPTTASSILEPRFWRVSVVWGSMCCRVRIGPFSPPLTGLVPPCLVVEDWLAQGLGLP